MKANRRVSVLLLLLHAVAWAIASALATHLPRQAQQPCCYYNNNDYCNDSSFSSSLAPMRRRRRLPRQRSLIHLSAVPRGGGGHDRGDGNDDTHLQSPLRRLRRIVPRTVRSMVADSSSSSVENSNALNDESNNSDDVELERAQRGMSIALAVSHFTVMGAKCALPSVLTLLRDPTTGLIFPTINNNAIIGQQRKPEELVSLLFLLSTLAVALGKLLLGPVIDRFGGILSLQVALSALSVLLAGISMGSHFTSFAVAWIFVDFIFSSCWAGCINAIHQSFPPDKWAGRIGTLAAAARTGNALAFASFAGVLKFFTGRMRQTWRPVFAISAAIQLVSVALLRYYGGKINKHQEAIQHIASSESSSIDSSTRSIMTQRPSLGRSLKALSQEALSPEFWLHLTSRSVLMVFASFLLFVPTLMCKVYSSSDAFGAQTGSIYALGCLLAVTGGFSRIYTRLARGGKVVMLIGLLTIATASSMSQLLHMNGTIHLSAGASAILLFLWGFAFAIPFYIPPSLYALSRGGVKSSATIADVFDIGGFSLLAIFNGYVAGIEHSRPAAWIPTFKITSACSAISLVSVSLAVWLEGRPKPSEDTEQSQI